jgi:hypothetical protein
VQLGLVGLNVDAPDSVAFHGALVGDPDSGGDQGAPMGRAIGLSLVSPP